MTELDLLANLEAMAERWSRSPHLFNLRSEAHDYGELRNELGRRFGIRAQIAQDPDGSANHYRVCVERRRDGDL